MATVRPHLTFSTDFKRKNKSLFVNPYPTPETLYEKSNYV